ncbi:hypothetical protein P2H44_04360 [Albimonas sp. CAU 1670]|uniref:hypothetical protein n=1 Tax=Albimonas sp. CAU 1670 TaxID=3032599 RepID=UPI0023DBF74C|nr:hypothetical protein [Albimonas sp. CAU 1670]MDF2231777.1 hypothetical protein [Albimonas sp. CAU 1670]
MHKSRLWKHASEANLSRRASLSLALGGAVACAGLGGGAARASTEPAALSLVMFEKDGCIWCRRWLEEIGPIYPKTEAGRTAPLRRLDIHDPLPDGLSLERPAVFTPTFVLTRDGVETGRIEGYGGEAFFWGLLEQMLTEATR